MLPTRRSLRLFVVSPRTFFAERPPEETAAVAIGAVVLFSVCLTIGIALLGSFFASGIDSTVTIDNPDRPPGHFCEHHGDDSDSAFADQCAEPETVDRDAGELLGEATSDYLWIGVVAPFAMWFLGGLSLYVVGRVAGGSPSFVGALALAGWAAIPEFFRLAVGLIGLRLVLRDITVDSVDQLEPVVTEAMAPLDPFLLVATLLTAAWQWHILSGGLSVEADIPWSTAAVAVAVPLGFVTLVGI